MTSRDADIMRVINKLKYEVENLDKQAREEGVDDFDMPTIVDILLSMSKALDYLYDEVDELKKVKR